MASLQGHMMHNIVHENEEVKVIHKLDIRNGLFPEEMPKHIESDSIVEFQINGKTEYDIFQVYKDGNDYYRIDNGYELLHIKSNTPENERRIFLSLALNQPSIDFYFCIIPSSESQTIQTTKKCPKINCEKNCLKIQKPELKLTLDDKEESQKVYLSKGDTIELNWKTNRNTNYRIEERKYCPISGGVYSVEQTSNRTTANGKYSKTFNDFGMSFLFRLTDKNEVHDMIICVVNGKYKIKHIEITDDGIQPNIIWIEQSDWILFDWNTKRKQTITQIEPFQIDDKKQQSIEVCL